MLTMKGIHHLKGNVHQLYSHQSKGGRGLTGVDDTHNCECAALVKYVLNITDPLTQIVKNTNFNAEIPLEICLVSKLHITRTYR
eukprot:9549604-Ditylum_brightwellii.AAC.1